MQNSGDVFLDQIRFEPLARSNWGKFVQLFGEKGACDNCWCMYYRLSKADYKEGRHNGGNRDAMKELVMQGRPTGILGLYEEQPIAWCAFAPREDYIKLERSRVHKRIDQLPVWSITCFFVDKSFRHNGISGALLKGVISYAKGKGIKVIEAYPAIPTKEHLPDSSLWVGLYSAFKKAGFEVVDRTSPNRPMVRYYTEKRH